MMDEMSSSASVNTIEYVVGMPWKYLKLTQGFCIYLDPPYASGRDYKFSDKDENVAFTDKFTPDQYKDWLTRLIKSCKRRLSKNGTLWFIFEGRMD